MPDRVKYTDIVRLVEVKHKEDIELGVYEELIDISLLQDEFRHRADRVVESLWAVLHVRKYNRLLDKE
jgi:hypothetical protein|tara:strand:- start:636 stop:839 length:204 start_codon:yes stop_codon:yes gene_type:complete